MKKSSAQITKYYAPETLVGRQVVAVVNFPSRQIGPFMSEVLTLGVPDENGEVVESEPTVGADRRGAGPLFELHQRRRLVNRME